MCLGTLERCVKVREAKFDDWKTIYEIGSRNGLGGGKATKDNHNEGRDSFAKRWREHPSSERFKNVPIGWLLEDDEGHCVGTFSNHWGEYSYKGKYLRAGIASAWAVDEAYRGVPGLMLLNAYLQQGSVDLLIDSTASLEVGAALQAFKLIQMPETEQKFLHFWIINYELFFHSASLKKKIPVPKFLCNIGGKPISIITNAYRELIFSTQLNKIELLDTFDHRFNVFWEKLKNKHQDRLLAYRDAKTLNWHWSDPQKSYHLQREVIGINS